MSKTKVPFIDEVEEFNNVMGKGWQNRTTPTIDKKDAQFAKSIFPYLFIDSRTLDCNDSYTCADVLYTMKMYNINNLDCGTYQINTKYWEMANYEDYFDLQKSYKKACEIIEYHTKDELSWVNIAKYHSKTKKHNKKYKERLFRILKKNMKKN